ncbi:receptor-type tyrosine-protein phosphatase C [Ctenopharyngodon idella]|uniref:receptor-type tyrosine-protein phosphatase C n=1 Tax=Ctenopharyngodon idella TaxID=7959 RepID=UPI00222EE18F|nr:receptor-type tyrosine-protein phosphatase C [Ctenopharyngodon idella]XP_051766765.1 receptor-type tyrosine-protein phosphatase C [Ctenopharyngodon idella]XP_051766766.1 receptor-type tyrosine-protein phosphatase C [Ctenopharyngodon idella]XP_051766767.1 receptor-type tyrosine-protein phosphatase C [Ctenopharyngodon idella]XP_051766768.1 receptor-type tyrosine-protein phosphatase C [Ctenopharyngodon idella]XP_051766769.1 receptor-type tyrosine-protein phosphatase C [Ctenopharyngodon idella]
MQSISTSPALTTSSMGTTVSPCKYNLTERGDGSISHVVNVNGSPDKTYTVTLMSRGKPVKSVSSLTAVEIKFEWLKPCTIYTISVNACEPDGDVTFISSDQNKTVFRTVVTNDSVCFEGEFKNTTQILESIKITQNNSCKPFQKHITFDTCNYTTDGLVPPVKPIITFNETIPSQFQWTNKPEQCHETFNITCSHNNENKNYVLNKPVSLLPDREYSCFGEYRYRNQTIKSNNHVFTIKCDWQNAAFTNISSDTFEIYWNSSLGDKCSGVKWKSYSAKCGAANAQICKNRTSKNHDIVCTVSNLEPFTLYKCKIEAEYMGETFNIPLNERETHSTNPKFTSEIKWHYISHNSIGINCGSVDNWNGRPGTYDAEIKYNGERTDFFEGHTTCSFNFSNLYYLTTYDIEVTARNKEGDWSQRTIKNVPTKYNDKAVIGFLAFLIVLTSIALLFVLFKIYLLKRKHNAEDEEILLTQPLRPVEPIYADNLIEAYKSKIADEGRLFMDEFQSIPRIFSNYTIKEAKKQENQSKNRYVDILPYDYNRVPLTTGGEREYINASFIEGYQEPKKYIAAQGPKDETIDDFWRMVWEQKSSIIVMVTRCEEGNKIKCAQYWPSLDRETEIFEDFVVKIRAEEHCPDYIIRYLVLANKREKAPEREVTHIQFISWPDHGVPQDPSLLLKLRRRVNSFKNFFSGPVVVHCSAGVGRTGTYIGIDAMIESLEAEGRVDIYGFVAKLRRQRCLMVQVEPQYILIHTALIEHNQFGETEVPLTEFHSVLNTLRQKDGSDPSLLELEFQKLPKFKNWRTFNAGSSEDNKKKNRYSSVIPYDFNRVLFRLEIEGNQTSDPEDEDEYSSDEEEESNEYINASFIDGYWCHKSLIAAQGPLPNTTEEFLLMLYQQQTKTLVMLTDCQEDGKDYCSQYWGDEKKVFGDMEIEVKKTESFPAYVRRRLEIQSTKKKEILEVDQYQFLKWRGSELPENAQELIEMMKSIRENGNYDNSNMNRNVPIVVHCNNGSSRTGIFCALWNLMDSALTEKLVDVFQEVKNMRKGRQGMVETYEQYQFLYTALEGAFPVQNGAIKTPTATDSAQVINETTALLTEANSTTGADQKKAEDSKATESSEQEAAENSAAAPSPAEGDGEKTTTEGTTNGPAVTTVEV